MGWLAKSPPPPPPNLWIQFCLQGLTELHKIHVASISGGAIDKVKVSYSIDNRFWSWYAPDLPCPGDHELTKPFKAVFVRLHPTTSSGCIPGSLQAEMWGKVATTSPATSPSTHGFELLQQIMNDGEFADCRVVCGSTVINCHRSVLAAVSPVWHAALRSNFREAREATISIQDAEPAIVKALLKYAYTGEVDSSCVASLLPLAHRYELPELVGICAQCMFDEMTVDNAVSYVSLLNMFIEHEKVAIIWPLVVDKVSRNREFGDILLRSVRQRRE